MGKTPARQAALNYAQASLAAGRRPGGPIMGPNTPVAFNDRRYELGARQKDSLYYPNGNFEVHYQVHYMVNDDLCMYLDLKATDGAFPYPRKL